MAWSFVGVSAVVQVTATAHTLSEPAGVLPGDLLVAVISSRIASTTSITLPAGWALVAESKTNNVVAAATTSEASGMMAYIVRGASAPALTFTHPTAPSVAVGRIVAYRGQKATSPFDVGIGAKTGTAITAVSTTGLTTVEANELIVKGVCSGRAAAFSAHDAATDPTTSSATGSVQTAAPIVGTWQERQDASTTTGADTALAIADAIRGTAGATGVLTCTASVSGGHAQVAGAFKIEPAFPFGYNNGSTATVNVTVPATISGDVIIVAGSANSSNPTIQTAGGQSVVFGTLGGMTSPRYSSNRNNYDFVGIIPNPAVGTTTVTLTSTTGNNEMGCWVVAGLTNPVQDKGIWNPNQINNPVISGLTGALAVATEFAVSYGNVENTVASINTSVTGSSGFVLDAVTSTFGSGFSHKWTAATTQIQSAFNTDAGGGAVVLATYRSTPPAAPTPPPISLVGFASNVASSTTVTTTAFPATQAGDCIVFAGVCNAPDIIGIQVKTNNNDIGRIGRLGTGIPNHAAIGEFVGVIPSPTVGSTSVTLSTTNSQLMKIAAWVVRGMPTPVQDKGVFTVLDDEPISVSGLTGTLGTANEFAISVARPPNWVGAVNVDQTGSGGFLLDTLSSSFDGGFSHQITEATTSIQAAWDSSTGGADVAVGTYRSGATTPGTSAIAQTGSALNFSISSAANSGTVSSTITVPSDAQMVCVGLKGWSDEANFFTSMTFTKGGADTAMTRVGPAESGNGSVAAIFYLVLPDTGTNKSLKFDWAGTNGPGEAPLASVTFWKGIDTASPVRSTGASLEAREVTQFACQTENILTAQDGDRVIAFAGGDNPGSDGTVDSWLNLNLLTQCTKSADRHDGAWATYSPSTDLYVGALTATGITYGCISAIVLKPTSSPVVQTGSVLNFGGTTANTGTVSSTITVPADAEFVVVGVSGFIADTNPFTSGQMTFTKGGADTVMGEGSAAGDPWNDTWQTAVFYMALPDTGTNKSLKWDWKGTTVATVAPIFSVTFWKGVDTASPVRSTAGNSQPDGWSSLTAASLTAQTGDRIIAWVGARAPDAGEGSIDSWSNLELFSQLSRVGTADGAWATGAPTGNTTVAALTDTAINDAGIVAIVVKPAATGFTGTMAAPETVDVFASTGGLVRWQATLAVTETVDVLASPGGLVRWQVTLAAPEAVDVAAVNATVRWAAPLATTEAPDVGAFVGNVARIAILATREGDDVTLFNGDVLVPPVGDLATTEAADTAALIGTTSWQTTLATTEAVDVLAFLGTTRWAVTLATTEAPDVAALVGTTKDPATGPFATREDPDVAALLGTTRWVATLATTEAADVAALVGATRWVATFATIEAPDVAALTGVVRDPISATLGTIEGADVGALVGNVYVPAEATLATTEAPDAGAFTGGVQVAGTLGTTEAPDVAALVGTTRWAVALATTEAPDALAFLGATRWAATLATTEAPDAAALVGTVRRVATLATTEAPDTAALTGTMGWAATLTATEAADALAFLGGIYAAGPLAVTEAPDTAALQGGIYATGTLTTTEAPDAYSGLGTIIGAGINANLAVTEPADTAAFTGQVTGVAGILAAGETADAAAFIGTTRWVATLATTEAADQVAFLGTPRWVVTLATTEAKDVAAMVGTTRWSAALATTEAPDQAAFTGIAGALAASMTLATVEAPDGAAFTGSTLSVGALATTEGEDRANIVGIFISSGVLETSEAPDVVLFDEAPADIATAEGRILASGMLRVRELTSHRQRMRVLKYPVPRPRELLNRYRGDIPQGV